MNRLGFKLVVSHANSCLGEVDVCPVKNQDLQFPNNEIRIHHFSSSSERCPPLSVLQTISPFAVRCKLEAKPLVEQSPLIELHSSCLHHSQTAVVLLGDEELHLVAMPRKQKIPSFWCFSVSLGLYDSCLGMLNLRCLAIVFDLDETLIVANTMKSFEDRIEALQRRLECETDSLRVSGMCAELRRYIEDKALLKQYVENDAVTDNGKLLKVQPEEVHPLSDNQERLFRPVIRLQEKNIVLTRINPEIRDTSVLVRLRPAWEDLRSYLTAKGRKRFEVYVCTMAERDYALEMWRLLDPEAHLISSKELLTRIVCVKSGSRKSLLHVFQDGFCHPKMAMVIDDRLKVWEDKDQSRVHVVPAFTPYYAPQAETANAVPVLCVARNVACNVRGGFFKEFDENLLRRISEVSYEDEVVNLPSAPDVSNYLMSEDAGFVPNGNRDIPISEGMNGSEIEHRLNRLDEKSIMGSTPFIISNPGAFARREVNSELDPDTRRRLLILQHGQDTRDQDLGDNSLLARHTVQMPGPSMQPRGGWLVEEDISKEQHNSQAAGSAIEPDLLQSNKLRVLNNQLCKNTENSVLPGLPFQVSQVKNEEAHLGHERQKQNHLQSNQSLLSEKDGASLARVPISNREHQAEAGKLGLLPPSISIRVLHEIGRKCHSKVEFRSVVSTSKDLQFCVEVLFSGEKIGVGMSKTKKDAQQQAAENALHNLADKYVSYIAPGSGAVNRDFHKLSIGNENGFLWDIVDPESKEVSTEDAVQNASTSEAAEAAPLSSTSVLNHQAQKRANSPRSPQTIQSKRSKEELLRGLQGLSCSRYQKNGHPVS